MTVRLYRTTYYLHRDCLHSAPLPEPHRALIFQGLLALQQHRPRAKYSVIEYTPAEGEVVFAFYDFGQPWPERQEGLRYRLEKEGVRRVPLSQNGGKPVLLHPEQVLPRWHPFYKAAHILDEVAREHGLYTGIADPPEAPLWQAHIRRAGLNPLPLWTATPDEELAAEVRTCQLDCPGCMLAHEAKTSTARHRTAIVRRKLSRPVQQALKDGLISQETTVLDYGCGKGEDVAELQRLDITATGWDPVHKSYPEPQEADIVNLGYVINVIENPAERLEALNRAFSFARKALIVSAQVLSKTNRGSLDGVRLGDGVLTRLGTFQKYFTQKELRHYVESGLSKKVVYAAPAIFYVFRHKADRKAFQKKKRNLSSGTAVGSTLLLPPGGGGSRRGVSNQPSIPQGETKESEEVLVELRKMVETFGRPPTLREFPRTSQLLQRFGSLQNALAQIEPNLDAQAVRQTAERRKAELQVCLVRELLRGKGSANFRRLSPERQADVRAFFSSFEEACQQARELIEESRDPKRIEKACRTSPVGKLLPGALYIHISALPFLSPVLQALASRASVLASESDQANVVKIYRSGTAVSFLAYEDFDTVAHPRLLLSIHVPLVDSRGPVIRRERSDNPPILHRKELFVHPTYPFFQQFQQLTREEEAAGLFDESPPGRLLDWEYLLYQRGVEILGHRLVERNEETS
ncbi:MAG: DNA phosphorothioation-associated putative methyltransferase [Deltaproteobacteria bacterium]|nr:DNA phosphorothioation-associated putative methyltransferase [Deltaproteobacteria bacterium]